MSIRVRVYYSKINGACFVPHVALAQVFSRSAARAGLKMTMTEGFSPRPKMSFAPELPAGVVALNEPVDIYFESVPENLIELLNSSLPAGFEVNKIAFPDENKRPNENAVSLGKICKLALYHAHSEVLDVEILKTHVENYFKNELLNAKINFIRENWLSFIIKNPAQNPIGGLVKYLVANNLIQGWHEINLIRAEIGSNINFED